MAFKKFDRRARPTVTEPIMAIQKKGTFSINAATFELLARRGVERDENGRIHAELFFDDEEQIVGLRAAEPGVTTYPIRKQPNSESYLMTGRAFCKFHEIPIGETRQYRVHQFEDDIVGFSLEDDEIKS